MYGRSTRDFQFFYIVRGQDWILKIILDIEVKEPPRTSQLSKEVIMGTLKVNLGYMCSLK